MAHLFLLLLELCPAPSLPDLALFPSPCLPLLLDSLLARLLCRVLVRLLHRVRDAHRQFFCLIRLLVIHRYAERAPSELGRVLFAPRHDPLRLGLCGRHGRLAEAFL